MSRVGKKPINIPEGVTVAINDGLVKVKGRKGELQSPILEGVTVAIDTNTNLINVSIGEVSVKNKTNWGTTRALIQNSIDGVTNGFSKILEINGVGYKVNVEGDKLVLKVGFSHIVNFKIPAGIEIKTENNRITISGIEKELVGQVAANIRAIRKPEPYLGKGIKYQDEVIRRKVGKRASKSE